MKRFALIAVLLVASLVQAGTLNVNSASNYELKTAASWTAIGVTRPNAEWFLGNGTGYDTTNYGSDALVTPLTSVVLPSLGEGLLLSGQAANMFASGNGYQINNSAVLQCSKGRSFSVAYLVRPIDVVSRDFGNKRNGAGWIVQQIVNGANLNIRLNLIPKAEAGGTPTAPDAGGTP